MEETRKENHEFQWKPNKTPLLGLIVLYLLLTYANIWGTGFKFIDEKLNYALLMISGISIIAYLIRFNFVYYKYN